MAKSFASDNFASVHPEIMQAIVAANVEHSHAYGADPWTKRAVESIQKSFGRSCEVFFVYGGTGANVCALQACVKSFEAVICAESSHIATDECGAPEKFSGAKLLCLPTNNGKLEIESIEKLIHFSKSEHHSQPRVLSITQSTELGTVYTLEELEKLSQFCKAHKLFFHIDGARLYNAAAFLKVSLSELIQKANPDILSLGGTKNGLMFGEAIVVFNAELAKDMLFIRKQSMQLSSKMRFIAAQFEALFNNKLWLKLAEHSNQMTQVLYRGLKAHQDQIKVLYPVQANAIFLRLPAAYRSRLLQDSFFWDWNESEGTVRWMCSHDTQILEIELFLKTLDQLKAVHS